MEHKCNVITRDVNGIMYPQGFISYHFTPEQMDKEIERLSNIYNSFIINNLYGSRHIVMDGCILVEDIELAPIEQIKTTEENMSYR